MKKEICKFGIGVFLLAILAGFVQIYSQTTTDITPPKKKSFQETQEGLCTKQSISTPRTYAFREIPLQDKTYGPKPWYKKWFPFLDGTPKDKYAVNDIRNLRLDYGRPAPVGETKRSKQIRFRAEQNLAEAQQQGEQKWLEWLKLNPDAGIEEKKRAEVRIRFQGFEAARLPRFDWREYGLDVGEVGFQGYSCNTCWAFATVDAMQISRRLAATRSQKNDFDNNRLRPSVQQLVSCMVPKNDSCNINWHGEAFSFMVDKGLPLGGSTQYYANEYNWGCDAKTFVKALTWDFVSSVPQKVAPTDELKRALIAYGPVVSIIKFDNCLWLYGGGVFNEEQNTDGGHMVLIIGWDDAKEAWLIKNSYDTDWGENGFGWIKYGSNNIGQFAAWILADPEEDLKVKKIL
jgi:C1A family cysteine protease